MVLWLWVAFFLLVAILVAIDLGAFGRRRLRSVKPSEGIATAALWVLSAACFGFLLQHAYRQHLFGLGVTHDHRTFGFAWEQFLNAYITEIALSIDDIAIFALLFHRFQVRPAMRNRILFWSIIASLVMRAGLLSGVLSVMHLVWVPWVLAGVLFLAAFRTLMLPDSEQAFAKRWLTRLAEKIPLWNMLDPRDTRTTGAATASARRVPVLLVIAVAVAADLSLALDSVPAILAVTRDATIAIASSTLATLALRSLYVAIADSLRRLRYWKLALVFLLFGLAALHIYRRADGTLPVPAYVISLSLIGICAAGIGLSTWTARRDPEAGPLQRPTALQDLAEAVDASRRNFRKVLILIVGTAIILFGIVIAPLPGPGPTVLVPIGLAILATEFLWARKLLDQLKERTQQLQRHADRIARRTSPWLVPPIVVGYWVGMWALWHYVLSHSMHKLIFFTPIAFFSFVPVGYWAYRVLTAKKEPRPTDTAQAGTSDSGGVPPNGAA